MKWRLACAALAVALGGCEGSGGGAYARWITRPADLVAGGEARGELGDVVLGNDRVRVVIQRGGSGRGALPFGGHIIDADLVRDGGAGHDGFAEHAPALFLHGFEVAADDVEIVADGADGDEAVVRVRGKPADFLHMLAELTVETRAAQGLELETEYRLAPAARHVEIVGRLRNTSSSPIFLDGEGTRARVTREGFAPAGVELPLGEIWMVGAEQALWAPGAVRRAGSGGAPRPVGFDVRGGAADAAETPIELPVLPGLVAELLASAGPGVSYGVAAAPSPRNLAWLHRDVYTANGQAVPTQDALLVTLASERAAGVYYELPPPVLGPGEVFEHRRYFIVGDGDVASLRDELFRIRGTSTGVLEGRVVDALSGAPAGDASVHVLDLNQRPYSQVRPDAAGRFRCRLPAGLYFLRVSGPGRHPSPATQEELVAGGVEIAEGEAVFRTLTAAPAGRVRVRVSDGSGVAAPARVTVVGRYGPTIDGDPTHALAALYLGEPRRATDGTWTLPISERKRQFVEGASVGEGTIDVPVRPSLCDDDACREGFPTAYEVYVSRGPEHEVYVEQTVRVRAGTIVELGASLGRTVDTGPHVAVALGGVEGATARERLVRAAAEGLDVLVSTPANAVESDLGALHGGPLVDVLGTVAGTRLVTPELGVLAGFPVHRDTGTLRLLADVGPCTPGRAGAVRFDDLRCGVSQVISTLRSLAPEHDPITFVSVEQPRDGVLGYFEQIGLDTFAARPASVDPRSGTWPRFPLPAGYREGVRAPEAASRAFDGMSVLRGKRFDALHAFALPVDLDTATERTMQDHRCAEGHPLNSKGNVVLDPGGAVAYPGLVDDWLHLINDGARVTATASPRPDASDAVGGWARTYVYLGDAEGRGPAPGAVRGSELAVALREGRASVSHGVFLDMAVRTAAAGAEGDFVVWPVGSAVRYATSNVGREVTVVLRLKSSPYVRVDELRLYANGAPLPPIRVPRDALADGRDADDDWLYAAKVTLDADATLVAEAIGRQSLFPVVPPLEVAALDVNDAIDAVARRFGYASRRGGGDGRTAPALRQPAVAYALTNPIWLDVDADGVFEPPGNEPGPGAAPDVACPSP